MSGWTLVFSGNRLIPPVLRVSVGFRTEFSLLWRKSALPGPHLHITAVHLHAGALHCLLARTLQSAGPRTCLHCRALHCLLLICIVVARLVSGSVQLVVEGSTQEFAIRGQLGFESPLSSLL